MKGMDMDLKKMREKVSEAIEQINAEEVMREEPASVDVNCVVALMQMGYKGKLKAYGEVLEWLDAEESEAVRLFNGGWLLHHKEGVLKAQEDFEGVTLYGCINPSGEGLYYWDLMIEDFEGDLESIADGRAVTLTEAIEAVEWCLSRSELEALVREYK